MVMIFEKKKEFVEGTLSACMVEANIGVDHLMYSAESEGGMEIVTICYDDGWTRKVDVTGDSNLAIIKDISRRIDL